MIAARARPAAILALYGVEAIFAWMLAAPWAETLARTVGLHPDGDGALFWDPGMSMLIDVEHRLGGVLSGLFASTAIGLAVYAIIGVLLSGALLSALLGDPIKRSIGRGAETFWRLLAIGVVTVVVSAIAFVLVGVLPAYGLSSRAVHPRASLLLGALPIVFASLLLLVVASIGDLARARVVAHDTKAIEALLTSARDRSAWTAQSFSAFPRYLASFGLLGYAAALTTLARSVVVIFIVHQIVAALRVALRASVLSRALRHT